MESWRTIADEEHGYSLRLPLETPTGQRVRISREKSAGRHRVHASSRDESELYVEIVSFPGLIDHRKAVDDQREFLLARSPNGVVTPAEPSFFGSRPSVSFLFEGELDGKFKLRRIRFVDSATRTFRIAYDPGSELNQEILEGWRVREP